jgi:diguanylate cyclase (GGDEF)-like protein
MQILFSVLLMMAVAGGAFGVLAVLVSHLRYQKLILLAEQEAEGVLSADSAAFLILEKQRRGPVAVVQFFCATDPFDGVKDVLQASTRVSDSVWQLGEDHFLVCLCCEPENLPSVADPEPSAVVDEVTGVLGAAYAPRALRGLLAEKRRRNLPLSIFRVDVDRLAVYNEGVLGRRGGDAVLKRVAEILMSTCRETDLIARLEEDEFLIAVAGNADAMSKIAERMCERVRENVLNIDGETFRVTISIGLARMPEDGQNPNGLVQRAGLALQVAKQRGRGVWRIFDLEMIKVQKSVDRSEEVREEF